MQQAKELAKGQIGTESNGDGLCKEAVVRLFHSVFSDTLNILSARFPHVKGDGSTNEAEFNGLRAKILRSGNNQLRKFDLLAKDYEFKKVRETVTETKNVNTPVEIKKG